MLVVLQKLVKTLQSRHKSARCRWKIEETLCLCSDILDLYHGPRNLYTEGTNNFVPVCRAIFRLVFFWPNATPPVWTNCSATQTNCSDWRRCKYRHLVRFIEKNTKPHRKINRLLPTPIDLIELDSVRDSRWHVEWNIAPKWTRTRCVSLRRSA